MNYDIQTFQAFIRIAEEGTIAGAALCENTVPSAISRRISELESSCGTKLLYRHRRGVTLTLAGKEFLLHAKKVMAELEQLDQSLAQFSNGVRGQIRLLANTAAVVQFLAADIANFLQQHSAIIIDLEESTSEQITKLLLEGKADIGILIPDRQDERLNFQPYRFDQLVVMLPKHHPLARHSSLKFADTVSYDYIGLPPGTALYRTLSKAIKELQKPLRLRMQTRSFEGIRKMVAAGLGIGILPQDSVLPYLEIENLVAIPLDEVWATRQMMIATRKDYSITGITKLLIESLVPPHNISPTY